VETEDGRIYVTSPDIKGFHFILEPDDDPMDAMLPTLEEMLRIILKADKVELRPAYSPARYRAQKFLESSISNWGRSLPETVVAAVA